VLSQHSVHAGNSKESAWRAANTGSNPVEDSNRVEEKTSVQRFQPSVHRGAVSPSQGSDACIGLGIKCMTPFEMLHLEQARFILGSAP
jgi:hypothetical protein